MDLKGYQQVVDQLSKLPNEKRQEADNIVGSYFRDMERQAKRQAPIDMGQLRNQISVANPAPLKWEFISAAPYSGYVNFGTKKKYQPVQGYEDMASQLKGTGTGTFDELLKKIKLWVKRKGLVTGRDRNKTQAQRIEEAAFLIAMKIARNGVSARPFYTDAVEAFRVKMFDALKKAFK